MDRAELQAIQRPIKDRFRVDPEAALITLRAEGDLDFRGTMAIDKSGETPVGFSAIRLIFEVHGNASEEQLATLLDLTERYCVVYQTLTGGVPVTITHPR